MEKKTAFEILQEKLTIEDTVNFRTMHLPEILTAMEKYAKQETEHLQSENERMRAEINTLKQRLQRYTTHNKIRG